MSVCNSSPTAAPCARLWHANLALINIVVGVAVVVTVGLPGSGLASTRLAGPKLNVHHGRARLSNGRARWLAGK
jgi:hypothetical protein